MPFTLISFAVAALMLLPRVAMMQDWDLPLMGILRIPATGIDYMGTFFHELGHTAARWLFGYPALPTFDFEYGGGMTYSFDRNNFVLGCVWFFFAVGAAFLAKHRQFTLLVIFGVLTVIHIAAALTLGGEIFSIYMGHGGEILVGAFCLFRGAVGHTEYGAAERWLNMIFGFYMMGRNAVMSTELITDEGARMMYDAQKGGHGFGDFSRIADILSVRIESVAWFSIVVMIILTAAALWTGRRLREDF